MARNNPSKTIGDAPTNTDTRDGDIGVKHRDPHHPPLHLREAFLDHLVDLLWCQQGQRCHYGRKQLRRLGSTILLQHLLLFLRRLRVDRTYKTIGYVFLRSCHLMHDHLGESILPTLDYGVDLCPKSLGKAVDYLLILIMGLRRWDPTGCAWSNPGELHII
ncbi:hypothetical protein CDL15_Pgr008118 [Punica granatum]|uniref:Uncharacterized protein n=1 Tax=Punica granatum TaxID=22663 RepID=A0A218VSV6_PUNGR|nr:hypothetical protein CDL15_Pgr008118 [Punica granatum]